MLEPGPPKGDCYHRGGESVENLVRGDSFKAKAKAKPKQSPSTKHAGRPADFLVERLERCARIGGTTAAKFDDSTANKDLRATSLDQLVVDIGRV